MLGLLPAVALVGNAVGHESGLSIGLNFGADEPSGAGGGTLAPAAVAGVVKQANWNNLTLNNGTKSGVLADLRGAGSATSVSVTWSCPNTWSSTGRGEENNQFPAGSADRALMLGYLDTDNGAGVATVTVTGLPADFSGGYDVIVYALGGTSNNRYGVYSIGAQSKVLNSAANPATFIEDPGVDAADTGNYAVFRNVTGSSFTLVANAVTPVGNGFRAPINAIQIVSKGSGLNVVNVGANPVGSAQDLGGGTITVVGGGNDIWDQTDEFTYAYAEKSGDFDMQVRVESLSPNARWSKAGLMVRESLSEDSRMVFLRVTPPDVPTSNGGNGANDTKLAFRTGAPDISGENGGNNEVPADQQNPPPYPNAWLRLVRAGNVFSASISADGAAWTPLASQDTGAGNWVAGGGAFRENVVVGLAVGRHSGGATATAAFKDFRFNELPFTVLQASSRGNPKGILVTFSGAPDSAHLDPLSYSTDPVLNIESVTSGPVPNSYWLNTTETLTEGTSYTVMVFGPTKGGVGPVVEVDTFVHGAGYEARGIHVGLNKEPSGSLSTRYGRTGSQLGLFSTAEGQPGLQGNSVFEDPTPDNGSNERYSARIFGILNITTAGNYVFAGSSDDMGEGFLSTDANPANKALILREPVWNGSRSYTTADRRAAQPDLPGNPLPNISTPKNLAVGEYYVEYVYAEGGGGNNGSMTWQPPGAAAITAGQSPIPASAFVPTRYFNGATKGELFRSLGPVSITQQPASKSVQALQPVTFAVRVDGTPAYKYQWRRNGTPIPGANGSSFTIGTTLPADDQAKYSVVIANEFSSVTSADAVLTVINPDPPRVLTVAADSSFTTVTVKFDNKLQPSSATATGNYSIPGLTVTAATLVNETTVKLTTSTQTEGAPYTLTISNVRELTGINAVDPNPTVKTFSALAFTPGFITREWFFGITGDNSPDRVLESAKYINNTPDYSCLTNIAEANAGDTCDNCGERVVGLFVPRESGPHTFFIAADDGARLFLSSDESPANKAAIANEPVWAARREWNGEASGGGRGTPPANVSAPIDLVAGKRYYIEAVVKEGGGGDHVAVAVQNPSDATSPANGSTPITGDLIGVYASPDGATLAITQQPAAVTVLENASASFTVAATGSSPVCGGKVVYQWQKNGVNIPGATAATLTLPKVGMADNGSLISCNVYVPGRKVTSSTALLTVLEDNTGPVPVAATGSATFSTVTITFNELIDPTTAADTFNYTMSGGLNILGVVLNGDGRSVTLTTDPQAENTEYSVGISLVTDLVGNEVAAGTSVAFRSWVGGCTGVEFALYKQVGGGTDINILVNHPTFPNSPDEIRTLQTFDTGADIQENYGGRVRGLFIPPVSGAWNLFVTADDGSRLFFNPTGPSAAGKVLISEETPGCCTGFSGRQTGPFNLVAGQGYYLEGIYKEAGGGDYIRVAARLVGDTTALAPMPAAWAGYPAAPAGVGGPVNITAQPPATLEALEQTSPTISVTAENPNGLPLCYQWQVSADGGATFTDIAGATRRSLTGLVDASLDGAKFRCRIGVIGTTVFSAVTTLDVLVDEQAPTVVGAKGSEFFNAITLVYSELMDETSVKDTFNYDVDGGIGTPQSVDLLADGKTVVLNLLTPLAEGQTYTVTINNVKDRSARGNEIAANTRATFRSFVVSCGTLNFAIWKNIGGTAVSGLTGDPRFPNSPDERAYLTSFDTRGYLPTDALENYGGRITGYFVPPVSGDWVLYLRSDDASQLFFDKKDGAGKQLVTEEPGCCAAFTAHATAPLTLVAGEKYPIEVLYKEGGGGDYAQVAARLASDTTSSLVPVPATMIAAAADPTGASITIAQQPADVLYVIDPMVSGNAGSTLKDETFTADGGGYTVSGAATVSSPWAHNAASGTWKVFHDTAGCNAGQNNSFLASPELTVSKSGRVSVVLRHRFSFEGDNWDGGQLRVSVNGGPFVTVAASAFSEGGYNSASLIGNHALLSQAAWNGDSANYGSGEFITSRAALGFANAGDTIRLQLVAAFDECATGQNPNWEVTQVTLTEGAQDPTFRIVATGAIAGNANYTPFIQWEKNSGSGWVAVPNGTGANLQLNPSLADNGTKYRAQLYVPGATATSSEATLTVAQLNTAPKFDCGPSLTVNEDAGAQVVAEWAKNISVSSIVRVPTVFGSAFGALPAGSRLLDPNGAATRPNPRVEGGFLKLTDANDPGGFGGWALGPFPLATYESLTASWKSRIGGGGGGGADGYSFNIGTDLADNFTGEEGTGTGLSVTVDTFDNGGGETGLEIRWRGERVAFQALPKDNDGSGNYLRKDTFVDATVNVDGSGLATFTYDGNTITAQLGSYTGIRATQVNFGARTGGANDSHWVDDLNIAAFPFDASSAEAGQTVTFQVSNDNPSLFSVQPAISANGTLTYTPAANACGVANVTVVAKDDGGTAYGGKDTSAECRFVITVNGEDDTAVAQNQTVTLAVCAPAAVTLTAVDPDANGCGTAGTLVYAIVSGPAKGALSGTAPNLTYTPTVGGADSFTFSVTDGNSVTIGTVSIVAPICNTPPVAKLALSPLSDFSPGVTHRVAISCNGSNVCLVADGSGSSDAETANSGLTFNWFIEPSPLPVASGEKTSVCVELGTQTVLLAVTDPQGATATDSITIEVLTAGEAIDELIAKVNGSTIERRNKRPFLASLKSAAAAADRGQAHTAQNILGAFQNKVRAQVGKANPEEAQAWIRMAQSIIDGLQPCVTPEGQE